MAQEAEFECSMCGRDGGPITGCSSCHGNVRYLQRRVGATLSEYRSGRVKEPPRGLGPKTHDSTWQGTDPNG
jgi:hypothetical protein